MSHTKNKKEPEIKQGGLSALDRRTVLKGAASIPIASLLSEPLLAQEVASGLATQTIATTDGREVTATIAMPAQVPAPAVLLIHEWWGLNDHIKAMAQVFADAGYVALAVDLYGGVVASDPATAGFTMRNVIEAEATATLTSWMSWLRAHEATTEKLGVCGWCFGGSWSLNASLAAPVDATVIYYGDVEKSVEDLSPLVGPVLGHFGTRDTRINEKMVNGFETALLEAGKPATIHWYEADHAFANPTTARYDEEDAKLAWERTQEFLDTHLN